MQATARARRPSGPLGRCFVGPVFDALVIGGGLSLPVIALAVLGPSIPALAPLADRLDTLIEPALLPFVVLLFSGSHFAASTVRLYTKPGTTASLPFLTMVFPLVALGALSLCVLRPDSLGRNLQALYLTWSPYHYAAQAYGLAVMYCYRSGFALDTRDKRWVRWASLLPFFYAFLATVGAGLHWILPGSWYEVAWFSDSLGALRTGLIALGLAAPFALYLGLGRGGRGRVPLISVLVLLANGIWWFVLPPLQAFVWATFFHGLQYLAIVLIFHVKDQRARGDDRHGVLFHAARFYAACLLLAYGLFNCLPRAYVLAGFTLTESVLLVTAAINVHHFIVDAFIWRLGRQDTNRAIVDSGGVVAPAAVSA